MNTLFGSLNCPICRGEQTCDAWYVNDKERTVRFCLDKCRCTGLVTHEPEERRVTEKEFNELKLEWVKPIAPDGETFQVAA